MLFNSNSPLVSSHVNVNDGQKLRLLLYVVLTFISFALYWPVRLYPFINYDDNFYVTENATVRKGLTVDGVALAFRGGHASNWHPVTTISHLIDCQLFGVRAGPPHLENVLLHASSVVLLFLVLNGMTQRLWLSATVAALFAWHPSRVEPVTWISERKDVLSTFFFMLTLLACLCEVCRVEIRSKSEIRMPRRRSVTDGAHVRMEPHSSFVIPFS